MPRRTTRKEPNTPLNSTGFQGFRDCILLRDIRGRMSSDSDIGLKLKSLKRKVALNLTKNYTGHDEQRGSWTLNNVNKPVCPLVAKARALLARFDKHKFVGRRQRSESNVLSCAGLNGVDYRGDTINVGMHAQCSQAGQVGTVSTLSDAQFAASQVQIQPQTQRQTSLDMNRLVAVKGNTITVEGEAGGSSRSVRQRTRYEESYGLGLDIVSASHNLEDDVLRSSERLPEPAISPIFDKDHSGFSDSTINPNTVSIPVENVTRSQHTACIDGQGCGSDDPSATLLRIGRVSERFNRIGRRHRKEKRASRPPRPNTKSRPQNIRKPLKVRDSFQPSGSRLKASRQPAFPKKGLHIYKDRSWNLESTHLFPQSEINVGPHQLVGASSLGISADRAHKCRWNSTVKPPVQPDPSEQHERQRCGSLRIPYASSGVSHSESSVEERKCSESKRIVSDTIKSSHILGSENGRTVHEDGMSRSSWISTRFSQREGKKTGHTVNGSDIFSSYAISGTQPKASSLPLTPASLDMLGKIYNASSYNTSFETIEDSGVELLDVKENIGFVPHRQRQEVTWDESSQSSSSSSGECNCQSHYSRKVSYHAKKNLSRTRNWLAQIPDPEPAKRRTQCFGKIGQVDYTHLFLNAFKQSFTQASSHETLRNGTIRYETIHFHRILFPQRHRDQLAGRFDTLSSKPLREETFMSSASCKAKEETSPAKSACNIEAEKQSLIAQQLRHSVWALDAFRFLNYGSLIMSPISRMLEQRRQVLKAGNNDIERVSVLDLGGAPVGDWGWAVAVAHEDFEVCTVAHHSQVGCLDIRGPENHTCLTLPCLWKLPFEDDSFDLISARTLHIYLHDRPPPNETRGEYDLVLRECLRILKPGGYIEYTLLDSEIVGLGPLGDALSRQFTAILREEGYNPEPSRTFGDSLVDAGFSIPGEANIFLPMGPRLRSTFFGLDMPEDQLVDCDEENKESSMLMNLASTTGLLGAHMWEQWLLKVQTETNKQEERRLDESTPVLLEKRAGEATGWNVLMGWAKKPTPSKVTWASRVAKGDEVQPI